MKVLWTLLKVVLALVLIVPVTIIVLGTVLGILGALLGLAILVLKVAVAGLIVYGAFRLIGRLLRGPAPAPQPRELSRLAPADPYYDSAMRELDRELGVR
jgi:hypothetical protein